MTIWTFHIPQVYVDISHKNNSPEMKEHVV